MPRPPKNTTNFKGRIEKELNDSLSVLAQEFGFAVGKKSGIPEIGMLLLREGHSLLQNPDQCPPLSPDFIRLRSRLHGSPSGTYADEPGRPAAGPTVVGNMAANERMAETINTLATLLAAKDAEIARLRALAFPEGKT